MGSFHWIQFLINGSLRNLWRSPRRTMISLLAIAAAAASLIVFQSFVEGVRATFRENVVASSFGHYQIFSKEAKRGQTNDPYQHLIDVDMRKLRRDVEKAGGKLAFMSRQTQFFGLLSNGDKSTGGVGIGIDAKEEQKFLTMNQVYKGKHLAESGEEGIFIGYLFAEKLGIEVGQYVTVVVTTASGSINALDFQVTGLFKSGVTTLDTGVYMIHYNTAESLVQTDGAQRILLGFENDDELVAEKGLNAMMSSRYPALEAVHWEKLAPFFSSTMGWLDGIFGVFRFIIILIATLSIINVFTITLMERIGEFGTLRAIGTRRTEIVSMIMVEGLTQAVLGSALGVLGAIGIITVALANGIEMPPALLTNVPFHVDFAIPWDGIVITSALCVLVAGGSGVMPAWKMSKVNIVEALGRNV